MFLAERAARIDKLVAAASVEQIVQAIMENESINAAELARRINAKAPQISRDLHGGLSRATLSRVSTIADASATISFEQKEDIRRAEAAVKVMSNLLERRRPSSSPACA